MRLRTSQLVIAAALACASLLPPATATAALPGSGGTACGGPCGNLTCGVGTICQKTSTYVWVPPKVTNAVKGDLILHRKAGVILVILDAANVFYTHSGIAQSTSHFAHTTSTYDQNIQAVISGIVVSAGWVEGFFCSIFGCNTIDYGDVYADPITLKYQRPGSTESNYTNIFNFLGMTNMDYWDKTTARLVKVSSSTYDAAAQANAQAQLGMSNDICRSFTTKGEFYNLYMFHETNLGMAQSHARTASCSVQNSWTGGTCSGAVAHASRLSGAVLPMNAQETISQARLQAAAGALYMTLYAQAKGILDGCTVIAGHNTCDRSATERTNAARTLADQIVGCFVNATPTGCFRQSSWSGTTGAGTGWYTKAIGAGHIISPDTLYKYQTLTGAASIYKNNILATPTFATAYWTSGPTQYSCKVISGGTCTVCSAGAACSSSSHCAGRPCVSGHCSCVLQ